jgi:hypothetical protein
MVNLPALDAFFSKRRQVCCRRGECHPDRISSQRHIVLRRPTRHTTSYSQPLRTRAADLIKIQFPTHPVR